MLFEILKNLFVNEKSDWILKLNDSDIQPVIIQRFLSLSNFSKQARILNKFVYTLPPKMYLSAAWSVLFYNNKKLTKTPFIKFPKKEDKKHKYQFIFDKYQFQYKLSDTDMKNSIKYIEHAIDKDKVNWFSYYGAKKEYWGSHSLDISLMKLYGDRPKVKPKFGLNAFF